MKIWLTGGSGSGKSVVAARFRDFGYTVIDADKIARQVVSPGEDAYGEILAYFGKDFLLPDGALDRKKLGAAVFADKEKLGVLNAITHKYIIKEMMRLGEGEKNALFDAPLRNTFGVPCDKTLYVTAPKEERIARIMARDGICRRDAENRIGAQSDDALYRASCDAVLENDGDIETLYKKADAFIKEWYTT